MAELTRETLEATPERMLKFLRAIGTSRLIRAAMGSRGYTEADHKQGWRLLHTVSGFVDDAPPFETGDSPVRDAIATLDAWDEDGYRLVRAALTRLHPEAADFVLKGLGPTIGPAAILSVKNLLDRLDALARRPDGKSALETLAKRGLTTEERARLRELVKIAESAKPVGHQGVQRDDPAEYVEKLRAVRAWYDDWSEMAKVAVKRRDHLILMGLAKRKPPKKAAPPPAPVPA